jgi:S1/P1 Nuclease
MLNVKSLAALLGGRAVPYKVALVCCSLSLALIAPQRLSAWGNAGHEAVAYVAWQQMTPAARTRAIALIKRIPTLHNSDNTKTIPGYAEFVANLPSGLSQDQQNLYLFMRAATWPDSIKHQWLHDSDNPPSGLKTEVNIGFTDTASHGYWHFVDSGFASDKSSVPATPSPNAATQISALRTYIASNENDDLKSYDLIWLEHIVGDIHQPLHGAARYYQGKGDEGGNLVVIKMPVPMEKLFEGTQSKSHPAELHAFWDDLPGEGDPVSALQGAATFAKSLPAATGSKINSTDPSGWAMESLTLAKADAYHTPIGDGPKPADAASYMITQAYYDTAMKDAKSQIALAGARLAKLLNENLH